MKFKIIRTSTSSYSPIESENPLCKEAFQEEVLYDEGTEYERIVKEWFVNINTLQELIEFTNKYDGKIVIITGNHTPILEIYDYWRE